MIYKFKKCIALLLVLSMFASVFAGGNVMAAEVEGNSRQTEENTVIETYGVTYVCVEKSYVSTGEEQYIVIGMSDVSGIQNAVLVFEKEDGTTIQMQQKQYVEGGIAFSYLFDDENESSIYRLLEMKYEKDAVIHSIQFSDLGIDECRFGVNKDPQSAPDEVFEVIEEDNGETETSVIVGDMDGNVNEVSSDMTAEVIEDVLEGTVDFEEITGVTTYSEKKSNIVVVLDPGHGGGDSGAVGNSLMEKDCNLKIAQYCKSELEQYYGVSVKMTRENDSTYTDGVKLYAGDEVADLKHRIEVAASYGADYFVSIHNNAGGGKGVEIYYPNKNLSSDIGTRGEALAKQIQTQLVALGLEDRGIHVKSAQEDLYYDSAGKPCGVQDFYGVIRRSKLAGFVGIIIEHAFIDNKSDAQYLKDESFLKKMGVADATGIANYLGLRKGGNWIYDNKVQKWWYQYPDGSYPRNQWKKISGKWYHFDSEGYMQTGWITIDGVSYYLRKDGDMATGFEKIGEDAYYFDSNGHMQTGWKQMNSKWYYFGSDGKMAKGLTKIGTTTYYMDENGVMQTGWQAINGHTYFFLSSGQMKIGWLQMNAKWYYFAADGKMATGLTKIGTTTYYFDGSGIMQTGWQWADGYWYYFLSSGTMKTGWMKENSKWYFLCPNGRMATGLTKIGTAVYYMDGTGVMQTGWQWTNGHWYYFLSSGIMQTGWMQMGSNWYYFESDGKMATGLTVVGKTTYYMDSSGVMQTGWQWANGYWYYFMSSGQMKTGWMKENSKWYFLCPNGRMATGFTKIGTTVYYMDGSGVVQTGWKKIDGYWYYFLSSGTMKTGWITLDKVTYYLDTDGKMVTGSCEIDGIKYNFSSSGALLGMQATVFADLTPQQVIEKVGPLFTKDQESSGVLACVSLAQFILESGYGKSELSQKANNCFGMKKSLSGNTWGGSTWDGKSVYTIETKEEIDGKIVTITADFRRYSSVEDSIADHSAYLTGAKNGTSYRYAGLKGEKDYKKAVEIIKNGGYATSSDYAQKLCKIIEDWGLTKYNMK